MNRMDWRGRRVLVTGHTGFKGSWLSALLLRRGAEVFGLALPPDTTPALFDQLGLAQRMDHEVGDMRDARLVAARVAACQPDVIIHLAAQALVRRAHRDPVTTWGSNVMGTVHLLDALRHNTTPCTVLVATTDKVYDPARGVRPYDETAPLGGAEPYAASKVGTELVVQNYRATYFTDDRVKLVAVRAGNVIGGGDWADDRLIPDLVRARLRGVPLQVRMPEAVRPWQHVLDALSGYLMLAEHLHGGAAECPDAANIGPGHADQRSVRQLLAIAGQQWPGEEPVYVPADEISETAELTLDTGLAQRLLGWSPRWDVERTVRETMAWYQATDAGEDPWSVTNAQIERFESDG